MEPGPGPQPQPGPEPPPITRHAPALIAPQMSADGSTFDPGSIRVVQDGTADFFIEFNFADDDKDLAKARLSYKQVSRELFADLTDSATGLSTGSGRIRTTIPTTDPTGRYDIDFWLEDATGLKSGIFGLSYQLVSPPPPPIPATSIDVSGRFRIGFTSEFGGGMDDDYTVSQVGGSNRLGWSADCDDPGNQINCFHMDDAAGTIGDSPDEGLTFPFTMTDGPCRRITGAFVFQDGELFMNGHKSETAESFCDSTPDFPTGDFTGHRTSGESAPPPSPSPDPGPDPGPDCCKICTKGMACGDTCIDRDDSCHVGPGCACNG